MEVPVNSIIMLHGQRRTLKIITTQSKHTDSCEILSTVLQDAFTILNNNGDNHSENKKVKKMLEKIELTYHL